jgi:Tol biopolymer transport system component
LPLPATTDPSTIVVQEWNGLRDPASKVSQTAYPPAGGVGSPAVATLPSNAVSLRWSPDGSRMTYWLRDAPADRRGFEDRGLFLAQGDGSDPVQIALPRTTDQYASNGWWAGVRWAPTGDRFALAWDTHSCTGGADCTPPGGIDLFDGAGRQIGAISVLDSPVIDPVWSPDGRAVGWMSGSCANGLCENDAFHWQPIDDAGNVTTLPLERGSNVVWSDANRLDVVVMRDSYAVVGRVYSMLPDGADVRDIPWTNPAMGLSPTWSPGGGSVAALEASSGNLTVLDVAAGTEIKADVPVDTSIAGWAPDGDRLVLYGSSETDLQGYALYVISADGTGFASLGSGEDFAWMPAAATGPPP